MLFEEIVSVETEVLVIFKAYGTYSYHCPWRVNSTNQYFHKTINTNIFPVNEG